jgi:anti-sigma regulatory factor (Ser/Thr protein kinase)
VIQARHHGSSARQQFRHAALFYSGERDFVETVGAFVREGIEAGEPTLVIVDSQKLAALESYLGDTAGDVCLAEMEEVGGNPGRIISTWDDFVADRGAQGSRVRGVGEPVHPLRSADELIECQRHESLLNIAFADAPDFWLLCPYDVDTLDAEVIAEARASHPLVVDGGVERHSAAYGGLQAAARPVAQPLSEVPPTADVIAFDTDRLPLLRSVVSEYATAARLSRRRAEDLLLAVNELATNSIRHAGGGGVAHVWRDEAGVVCEVRDRGRDVAPLAGRLRPGPEARGGYGLWIVNQVCDLVQVRTSPAGSTVRLQVRGG